MPDHERDTARVINQSWPVLERYFDTPAWHASGTDPAAILRGAPWAEWIQQAGRVTAPLQAATAAAFHQQAGSIGGAMAKMSFKAVDAVAVGYAQTQGSKLIAAISDSQRDTVRAMVKESLEGKWTVDQLGRRLRGTVGLHPQWATAVTRFEERQYAQLIKEGKTPLQAEGLAARRAEVKRKSLLKRRGENIARTEVQTAANLGRFASWDTAISKGFASKASRKEFSPGPGACEICEPFDGEVVGWNEPFSNGKMMPPFHPSCRCTAILLPPDYNDDELDPDPFDWLSDEEVEERPTFTPTRSGRIGSLLTRGPAAPSALAAVPAVIATAQATAAYLEGAAALGTEAQRQVAGYYLGGARYNAALRGGGEIDEYTQEYIDELTGYIEAQPPLQAPAHLYRGMSATFLPDPDALVGTVIKEPAFMSTSLRKEEAEIFAGSSNGVLVEIVAPTGTKGLSINIAQMQDESGIPAEYRTPRDVLAREAEMLLTPGTAMQIVSVEDTGPYKLVKAVIVNAQ